MNKARSLIMLAALVLWTALSLSCADGGVQAGSSTIGRGTQVLGRAPLPRLSDSAAPELQNAGPSQSDNSTAAVSSSGAVKASFTVFSRPVSGQGGDGASMTDNTAYDLNSTSAATPAHVVSHANAGDQPTQNIPSSDALDARSESGRLSVGWVLLVAVCSMAITMLCGLAVVRGLARR